MRNPNFTPEDDELIKRLKAEGMSATKIVELHFPGRSKNGIIGRWHRMGLCKSMDTMRLERRAMAKVPTKTSAVRRTPFQKTPEQDKEEPYVRQQLTIVPNQEPVGLLDLKSGECRWPVNDPTPPETFLFCGAKSEETSSYCPTHAKQAFK